MKKSFSFTILLICFWIGTNAQFTHTGRGMYVDKFFRTALNTSGVLVPNPVFSILSIPAKEDSLLTYCKNNHITYIILYDLHRVFGNATFEGYLCSFMEKAKTQYCIEKIGVASSCASMFDNVAMVGSTQPLDLNQASYRNMSQSDKNQLSLVEQALPAGNPEFYRSESDKMMMLVSAFNDNCAYKFDVMVTEFEFWNPGVDDCTGQSLTKDQKYVNYQNMIADMDVIRDNYNSTHTHQVYVETYLGYINLNTAYTHQQIANWIDGLATNGKRRVDRVLLHYYGQNPVTLYSRTAAGQNYTGYYLNRFLDFCQSTTNNATNFCPIFSAENTTWGGGATYLGNWLNQGINNNIFTAEKAFHNDWYADATTYSPGVVGSATLGNVVNPGGVVWFTAGQMASHVDRPLLFTSNSPICVASGQNGTFQFQYQGPIEQGSTYKFYITNAGTSVLRCGTVNPIAWPVYNGATQTSINLNAAIGSCALPVGDYDAHLELTYSNGCTSYNQVTRVKVVSTGQIVALTPTSVCLGNPVFLQASSTGGGTTSYQWYDNGTAVSGATASSFAPGGALTGAHNFKCAITSSVAGCTIAFSNIIPITFNSYPVASIAGITSSGCNATIQASPAGATYVWSDGSTARNYTTSWAGTYSVAVTLNGCTSSASYTYTKVGLLLNTQTSTCNGGATGSVTVNISSGLGPYSLSWSGPTTGSLSGLAVGNNTISNLAAGTYTITVTDASGCATILSPAPVVVSYSPIVVNTSSTSATCPSSTNGIASITSVTGGNGGPYTYRWLYNNSTAATLPNIPPGTYVVEVKDGVPCTVTKSITVNSTNPTVVPSVSISSSAGTSICSGASVTFTATPVNGGATPVYQWKKNGINVGTNSNTYIITTLVNSEAITCVLTSNATCATPVTATSNSITMTVNPNLIPSVTIAANPGLTICAGTNVTFTATPVNGGATPVYQWKKNGTNVGTNSATYSITTLANNDIVTCVMTPSAGCYTVSGDTSNALTMIVNPVLIPSVSISASPGNIICNGANVTFTATPVNGGLTPAYQWKKNGINVGTNAPVYSLTTLANNDIITCVLTSNVTCVSPTTATSNAITMTVNAIVIPSVAIGSSGTTICQGASVTFNATPVNGGNLPSYQWMIDGVNAGTNSASFTTSSLTNGDIVSCVLTSNATCVSPVSATSNSLTMTVNPNLTPSVSISANPGQIICAGTNVTFTATPVNGGSTPTYQWKKNGTNVGTNSATYSLTTLVNNDIVTCVMTPSAGCYTVSGDTSNALTMIVNPVLIPSVSISASPGNIICNGANVTFTATPVNGGSTPAYQWKKNGINVGTNAPVYSLTTLANNDIITCVLTSNATCVSPTTATSNAITMTVNAILIPSVSISIPGTVICQGTSVTFTATPVNGGNLPSYQWMIDGVNAGTNSASFTSSSLTNGDIVSCVLTSNATCVSPVFATSNSLTMTVNPNLIPSVSISANPGQTICAGTNVTFTATPVNGGSTPAYQWKKNGTNTGTNSTTYSITTLTNNDIITCVMTPSSGCYTASNATSNSLSITVNPVPIPSVSINSIPGNSICSGTSVTFTAFPVNGGSTPSYQWKKNGTNTGTNSTTFTSSSLVNNDIITCVLTSNATCATPTTATSNSVFITVDANVTPTITISSVSGTTICQGVSAIFNATITNGGGSPSYQWMIDGVNAGTNSASFTTTALTNGDIISCKLTSNATCLTTNTVTSNTIAMTVNPVLTPSVSIGTTSSSICAGTSVTFTATPVNGGTTPSYQWKKNGTNVGINSINYSNSTLVNSDVITCVMTTNAICASPAAATSNAITMTVTALVVPTISIGASPGNSICNGTSVLFTASITNGGGAPSYQWKINGTNAGTTSSTFTPSALSNSDVISCILTSNANCASPVNVTSNSITMSVTPVVVPSVSIASNSGSVICSGTNVTFTATPVSGGTPSYQWKKNNTNVGTNSPSYSINTLANNDVIKCEMTSNASCATTSLAVSNSITMTVNPLLVPTVSVSAVGGNNICANATVQFNALITNGGSTPAYQWKRNGSNVGTNSAGYSAGGLINGDIILCQLTSNATCATPSNVNSNSLTMNVTSMVVPSVSISANAGSVICPGALVTFTAVPVNGGAAASYQWKKNNANVGTNSNTYSDNTLTSVDIVKCVMTSNATCVSPATATSNELSFTWNTSIVPSVTISSNISGSICQGSNVIFTAVPINGGTSPVYQWKKNGNNVGTNSNTYNSTVLVDSDTVICEMTSNANCVFGNPGISNKIGVNIVQCGMAVNLKVFIQGFYRGGGTMSAVIDPQNFPGICDSITVALVDPANPNTDAFVTKGVIDINGYGSFYFPGAMLNTSYFIVIRHRNAIETWSNLPQAPAPVINFDFTVSNSMAYGSNMVTLADGNHAMWSGDITSLTPGVQDGVIDDMDLLYMKDAIVNFNVGYSISDITGDHLTESSDYSVIENNYKMQIVVARP